MSHLSRAIVLGFSALAVAFVGTLPLLAFGRSILCD